MSESWSSRADWLQDSLEKNYAAPQPQFLHNRYPFEKGDDEVFNYWWLAHLIDCRIDAYERTRDSSRLAQAKAVHANIVERNGGSLFNDYFDDMLWFALASLRLWHVSGEEKYKSDAIALWNHVVEYGWNDTLGPSLAWRKQQLAYKNTPANAPLAILGARLFKVTGEERYLDYSRKAFSWLTHNLVHSDGFVDDGINRLDDGKIDTQWEFTYNQGVYIGAALELHDILKEDTYLEAAVRTALVSIDRLTVDGVFKDEGEGGDEGLFKGIWYRYVGILMSNLRKDSDVRQRLIEFIEISTDHMWEHRVELENGSLLVGNDWNSAAQGRIYYSTQLSAIMAAELRAKLGSE